MAILTFSFLDNLMDVLHSEIFICKLFMAIQAILLDKLLPRCWSAPQCPFLWRLRAGIQKNSTEE
jgi:hypothetical protein